MSVGRRLSQWRRLVLVFGPASAKRVALALSEFSWAEEDDPDGALIARHCTQKILRRVCDYKSPRGLLVQLEKLEQAGWIERDDWQTGPGVIREYVLEIPDSVPKSAIEEMKNPSPGMWKRLLDGNTERTGEIQCTRSDVAESRTDQYQVNCISENAESGELERNIRCTPIPDQVNCISPLKESLSKSLEVCSQKGGTTPSSVPLDDDKSSKEGRPEEERQRLSNVLPDLTPPNEEVPQEGDAIPANGISDYKRAAILKLAEDGREPALIATLAGIAPDTVADLLREAL